MLETHKNGPEYHPIESVDREVLRGKNLQKEKLKKYSVPTTYDVIDIKYEKLYVPSSSGNYCRALNKRNRIKEKNLHTNIITKIDKQNFKKYKRYSSKTRLHKTKHSRKCSMRILELAVPTKRHCLETWRNKQYILPDYRVERLRQIVMDEKPIINLDEAVNYFQKRRVKKHRSLEMQYTTTNTKQKRQIKIFCSKLAYGIIQKLLPLTNIKIKAELQNISNVIQDDLRTFTKKFYMMQNFRTEIEIADKLTLWIANILEDSTVRLLLEDFEELKKQEEPVWNIIDTLINDIVVPCESEEQDEIALHSKSTIDEDVKDTSETNSNKYSDEEDFMNERNNISDFIVWNILENIILNSEQHYIDAETKQSGSLNQFIDDIINYVVNTNVGYIDPDVFKIDEDNKKALANYVQNLGNKNVDPDAMDDNFLREPENQQEGSVDEASNKKVKFSKLYIGSDGIITSDLNRYNQNSQDGRLQNNIKSVLSVAPPNEDLLSDADESWPEDLEFPVLKATLSVSKSIQSLGKIAESDEKSVSIPGDMDVGIQGNSLELSHNDFVKVKSDERENDMNA